MSKELARKLKFHVIANNWEHYGSQPWVEALLEEEKLERENRNREKRVKEANVGSFKPMSDFDWSWPTFIDREQVEELFSLDFIGEKSNVALVGTRGLGKTMIAQNLAHTAANQGFQTLFYKTSKVLNDLLECDGVRRRKHLQRKLCNAKLLALDEIGYLSYDNRYADLLYDIISERYHTGQSTIITSNKAFADWSEIFPTAACVITMVDKLVHRSSIIVIKGESYRLHEAAQREEQKAKARKARSSKRKTS